VAKRQQPERAFRQQIRELAKLYRWSYAHYKAVPVLLKGKAVWMTPVEGDVGGPDTLIAKGGRVLNVEVKLDDTYPTPEQRAWAEALGDTYRCWRPRDWQRIVEELSS
jgi:hypothetical protein